MRTFITLSLAAALTLSAAPSFADAMSASEAFEDLVRANYVSVETVTSNSNNQILFSNGRADFPVDIASLQALVAQNWRITGQLTNAGYSAADVIGILSESEFNVTLFVRG